MSQRLLEAIDANAAHAMVQSGDAVLIDVREPDEFAREHIPGARNAPLSRLGSPSLADVGGKVAIFHCNSGTRTKQAAPEILATGCADARILEGGLGAWKRAGLPVALNRKAPISIMRQVQLVAGGLVLLGVLLGFSVSPWFFGLSAFVGAGLMFAGATGHCGMASFLGFMPWNRTAVAAS